MKKLIFFLVFGLSCEAMSMPGDNGPGNYDFYCEPPWCDPNNPYCVPPHGSRLHPDCHPVPGSNG